MFVWTILTRSSFGFLSHVDINGKIYTIVCGADGMPLSDNGNVLYVGQDDGDFVYLTYEQSSTATVSASSQLLPSTSAPLQQASTVTSANHRDSPANSLAAQQLPSECDTVTQVEPEDKTIVDESTSEWPHPMVLLLIEFITVNISMR